tara:strand:+ start:693 stop:1118 length:426 start_codon:yes stop_codon:yes gene_type:complete
MTQVTLTNQASPRDIKIGGVIYPIHFNQQTTIPLDHVINILGGENLTCTFDKMDEADIARLNDYKFNELIRLTNELKEGDTRNQAQKILFPKKVKAPAKKAPAKKAPAKKAPAKKTSAKKAKKIETPKKETPSEDNKEVRE